MKTVTIIVLDEDGEELGRNSMVLEGDRERAIEVQATNSTIGKYGGSTVVLLDWPL